MRPLIFLATSLFAIWAVAPATAADKVTQFSGDKPVQIDPALAYITYRMEQKTEIRFLRDLTPEELADYGQKRSAAFAKERQRRGPEFSETMFDYPAAELDAMISVAIGPTFDRQGMDYVYLVAVKPGIYTLYGNILGRPNETFGTCFCLGSVKFRAQAGKVTDLGRIRLNDDPNDPPYSPNKGGEMPYALMPPAGASAPTGKLAALPVVTADLHGADKVANFLNVLIDRLPPISGVLDYDRDKVIDLRAK